MKSKHWFRAPFLLFAFVLLSLFALAQKKKTSLKDSLDGAFDMSDYLIEAHGFIPVPVIITEPALGGFGVALVPVFLNKNPPYIDSVNGQIKVTPVAPNITGGIGLYTANNSWMGAAFRKGTFVKSHIKYTVGSGFANINMAYYRSVGELGEKKFKFDIKTFPLYFDAAKRIGVSHWYAGIKYLFLSTNVEYTGDTVFSPDFVKPNEYKSIVSQFGAIIELDNRDNIFTPNRGIKAHLDVNRADNVIGSDFDYWRLNYYSYAYATLSDKLIGGLRVDGQQAFGDPPFFMLPYIDMRGVPINRYQGNADILTEAELRWDFLRRWSIMLYSGAGKAFDEWNEFGDAKLVVTYGTGFRYFIARKFGLRMGVDIAKGPDTWAYYIVFGSNWLK
ncbi:MAG TPA: hypothetical protein VEV83_16200 [Parafilimonas sp.]|nr:hypothetical protein [Parafilimonas sp.]